jgi:hypothetical protein
MIAAIALIANPAAAATLPQWTGPGENACAGRCSVEWALRQLPEATRADVVTAMRRDPVPVLVRDGDYLALMTYYRGGPMAQHGVVAVLDAPEPAAGWCVRGGCFVLVAGCANWAFLTTQNMAAGGFSSAVTSSRGDVVAMTLGGRERGYSRSVLLPDLAGPSGSAPFQEVPPIPLPASLWLLLSGMAALLWSRK